MKEYSNLYLHTKEEVEKYLLEYKVSSVDDLCALLYNNYHIQVVDFTQESEYTQDNAQNSREFADEGFSVEELEEIKELRNIYR